MTSAPSVSAPAQTAPSNSVVAVQPQTTTAAPAVIAAVAAPAPSAPAASQLPTAPVSQAAVVTVVTNTAPQLSAPAPAVSVPSSGGGGGGSGSSSHSAVQTPNVGVPSVSTPLGTVSVPTPADVSVTAPAVASEVTTLAGVSAPGASDPIATALEQDGQDASQAPLAAETASVGQAEPAAEFDATSLPAEGSVAASSPAAASEAQPVWIAMLDGQPILVYADGSTTPVPPDTIVYVMTADGPAPFDPWTAPTMTTSPAANANASGADGDSGGSSDDPTRMTTLSAEAQTSDTSPRSTDPATQSADAPSVDLTANNLSIAPDAAGTLDDSTIAGTDDVVALQPLPSLPGPVASSGDATDQVVAAFAAPPVAASSTTADVQYAQARPTPLPVIGRAPAQTDPETAGVQATSADRTSILVQVLPQAAAIAPAINAMLPSTGGPGAAAFGALILLTAGSGLAFRRLGNRKKVSV